MVDTRGSSSTLSQQKGNVTYGTMPEQVATHLKDNPGAEFIVIQRTRQGEEPKIWTSGDQEQAQSLFKSVYKNETFGRQLEDAG